ncbi:Epithelial membrane protein, partial [Operophtera brumata]
APAMVSFPHFYLGDPKLREDVIGLKPDPARHETLQINMQVKKTNMYTSMSYLDEGLILPVAWIEMGVEELPQSLKSLVYHGTYTTAAIQLGLTVICVVSLIVSSICLFLLIVQRRRKPCATLKKIPAELMNTTFQSNQSEQKEFKNKNAK